jgi:tetraacyldisaccharide-1-P 4'-kinase
MDGGGLAGTGRLPHIVARQLDGQLAVGVPDRQITAPADAGDGPAVAVLTQSVAVSRSRRSLARVMITSPTLAWLPSARRTSEDAGEWSRR